ncbi:ABC transporter ATP-binding protein [Alloscardovia theropitheci]|uniref:ABC transporter ATP-binding protein n=1 Tax=Alloscardovia theropitheci TaxID=2496842 RepID=A0A4R0QVZ1_9BIFI|nr:ABC transporter ATP-binding protein [Alloscardovia theropitheci]TCD54467.1 ABC transporter ATP-binding protein [Alloscardovia theropitheci]
MIARYYPRWKFVLLTLFSLISSTENIALAFMTAGLTNLALEGHVQQIPLFIVEVIAFFLIVFVAQLGYNYFKNDAIRTVNTSLRTEILRAMFSRSQEISTDENTQNESNSSDLGFLTNDFKLLETNRFGAQLNIIFYAFTLILSLGYALYINWILTIIFFIGSCIPLLASNFFQKPIQAAAEKWSNANGDYVSKTKNFLAGSSTINLYGQQDAAVSRNSHIIAKLENALMRMNLLNANAQTSVSIIAEIVTFFVPFLVGALLIVHHYTTFGSLIAILQLSNSFVNPILNILDERNNLSTTKPIIDKINNLLISTKDSHIATNSSNSRNESPDSIDFQAVSLSRNQMALCDNLNFSITKSKKIAIIGPSGCGKSTLLHFIMNGSFGKAQTILRNGHMVQPGSFSHDFAYASQAPVIFADTLEYNLTLGRDIDISTIMNVCNALDLGEVLETKGLSYNLGDNADQLSGGQLARIELARAILSNRSILLLDEVNASLDQKTSDDIHRYLLDSNLTFVEVIHHYQPQDLERYDTVIDFGRMK